MTSTNNKQWVLSRNDIGFDGLDLCETPIPEVGDDEVLVKLNATTLNYRDLAIAKVYTTIIPCLFFRVLIRANTGNIPPPLQAARHTPL